MDTDFTTGSANLIQRDHGRKVLEGEKSLCFQVCVSARQAAESVEPIDAFRFRFLTPGNEADLDSSFIVDRDDDLVIREVFRFEGPVEGDETTVAVWFSDGMARDTGLPWSHKLASFAGTEPGVWEPPGVLPDEMSRGTLRIDRVEVVRLNDIADEMARNAGYEDRAELMRTWDRAHEPISTRASSNPWIWVAHIGSVRRTWPSDY